MKKEDGTDMKKLWFITYKNEDFVVTDLFDIF